MVKHTHPNISLKCMAELEGKLDISNAIRLLAFALGPSVYKDGLKLKF